MAEGYRRKYRIAVIVFTMLIFLDIVGMMDSIYNLFSVLLSSDFLNNHLDSNSTWNSESSCMFWYHELVLITHLFNLVLSKHESNQHHPSEVLTDQKDPVLESPRVSLMGVFTGIKVFNDLYEANPFNF